MFRGCKSLGNLSLYFDTTSVTNMENMFSGCSSSEQIYLGDFVTSSVINMNEMFNGCSKVKRIYMPLFDTFNAKYMYHIFYDCNSLIDLDISNVVLYNLETRINDLFGNIENNSYLKNIYNKLVEMKKEENIINDIDFNLVMEITIYPRQNFVYIFGNSFNLYQIENSKMYVDNQEYNLTNSLFLENEQVHYVKILLEGKLEDTSSMFEGCENLEIKFSKNHNDTKGRKFDKSNILNVNYMFKRTFNITIDFSFFNTQNITEMRFMFSEAKYDNLLNFSYINTSSVTNMDQMFSFSRFTSLDLSFFDTSNVITMDTMFFGSTFEYLDLSSFNTSSVTSMSSIFSQMTIPSLDLSSFETRKISNMKSMFARSQIDYLNISNFNTENVYDMSYMFSSCLNLTSLDLSSFKIVMMFDNCRDLQSLKL